MAKLSSPIGPTIDVVSKTISSSVIAGGGGNRGGAIVPVNGMIDPGALVAPPPPPTVIPEEVGILRKQINALIKKDSEQIASYNNLIGFLQNQFNVIGVSVKDLGNNLNATNKLLQSDAQLEQQQSNQEIAEQKTAAETEYRRGAENLLEKKIQAALMAPVTAIKGQLELTLGNLLKFFGILFTGWLVDKSIELFKSDAEGNKKKFEDIKNQIIKNLFIAGGVLAVLNIGILKIAGKIASLAFNLGRFVLSNTLGKLFSGIASLAGKLANATKSLLGMSAKPAAAAAGGAAAAGAGAGAAAASAADDLKEKKGVVGSDGKPKTDGKPTTKPSGKPQKPGVPSPKGKGPAGGLGTGLLGVTDILTGDPLGATLAAGAFIPGPIGKISKIAAWGKELLVDLPTNLGLFPSSNQSNQTTQTQTTPPKSTPSKTSTPITSAKPSLPNVSTTPSPTVSSPQSSSTPQYSQALPSPPNISPPSSELSSDKSESIKQEIQIQSQISQPQESIVPNMGQYDVNNFNNTSNTSTNNYIQGSSNTVNNVSGNAVNTTNVEMGSVNQIYPPSSTVSSSSSNYQSFINPEFFVEQKSGDVNISPLLAETQKMPSAPVVGPTPQPKPNIIYASSRNDQSPNLQAPLKSGPASEVPFISSSNPDNFYLLYSQVQYNVVI